MSTPLAVVRDVKGIKRTIDVSRFLLELSAGAGSEALHDAGLRGNLLPFRFRVLVTGQGGVRPTEIMEALFPEVSLSARIVRTFMGLGGHEPLELEALRECARASAAVADSEEAHVDVAEGTDEVQACE
jgi:hypothetical protein